MQAEKGRRRAKAWEAKGSPICAHERVEKEYELGTDTGDVVCTTCGQTWWRNDPNRPD